MALSSLLSSRPSLLPIAGKRPELLLPIPSNSLLVFSQRRHSPAQVSNGFGKLLPAYKASERIHATASERSDEVEQREVPLGEDSAAFELSQQSIRSWVYFASILGAVLLALNVIWIDPSTGFGSTFVNTISGVSESPEVSNSFSLIDCLLSVWDNS